MKRESLQDAYRALEGLASQPECQSCRLCEEHVGLVYAFRVEAESLERKGVTVSKTSEGVAYVGRTSAGWCSCYNVGGNGCTIYSDRPLCCRLYPLDLMEIEGELWWVVHEECPISQRYKRDRREDVLRSLTVRLEASFSKEELEEWLQEDTMSQRIEAFLGDESRIRPLRRLGESSFRWGD